ncbi:MAG: hypothetical protein WCT49_04665 [Candidatus Paceibacterota bacterium]|jgi:hypothetical protein|nr:hypothetical protein [Candidatus Paceibacterota bacterium]
MRNIFHQKIISLPIITKIKKGFIMVETIVAVSIILMVVPAVLGMATKGITLGTSAKSQMIASYLASEGIEFIRNKRDSNLLRYQNGVSGAKWDDGFTPGGASPMCKNNPCTINPLAAPSNIIQRCSGSLATPSPCYRLYLDSFGFYSHDTGGQATQFYRGVSVIDAPGNSNEHLVTSTVVWSTAFSQKSLTVTDYITNWTQ